MPPLVKVYQRRQPIYCAGDPGGQLPKLIKGAVMLSTIGDDARRQVVDLAGPGDFLHFAVHGEIDHDAEALTDCRIEYFAASTLLSDPETATFLVSQMRDRIAIEHRHITMMARHSACDRLAGFLDLAGECFGSEEGTVMLPLTRQQIADFTGLTLETVSRTFARWHRERRLTRVGVYTYRRTGPLTAAA